MCKKFQLDGCIYEPGLGIPKLSEIVDEGNVLNTQRFG